MRIFVAIEIEPAPHGAQQSEEQAFFQSHSGHDDILLQELRDQAAWL
jgi:hypothetical protein